MKSARTYMFFGMPFQFLIMGMFVYRWEKFAPEQLPELARLIGVIGLGIFTWCLIVLYVKRKRTEELITTGIFKYTRHPMYTGLVITDIDIWWSEEVASPQFIILSVVSYGAMIIAALLQEKETVARFGQEAKAYYERTPRIFLMYPYYARKANIN